MKHTQSPITHTPGPWKADLSPGSFRAIYGSDGEMVCKVSLAVTKANSNKWQPDTALTEANAHLIAAAPDLLEELCAALCFVEDAENDPAFKPGVVAKRIKSIRAAIRRATGGTL